MNIETKFPSKIVGFASLIILLFCSSQPSLSQVTPNELSRLSLEELLGVEISDINGGKRWLFSYEFRYLDVGKYQTGTKRLSFDDVLFSTGETRTGSNFPIVPTFIKQRVHSFSIGRELSNKVSLSVTLPVVSQETAHISSVPDFEEFVLESKGVGDIALLGRYKIHRSATASASIGAGISFPSGSITKMGDTPRDGMGSLERLPYTMQIGSGTYDFLATASYEKDVGDWAVGANGSATLRTGMNKNNYRLGNNYGIELTARFKGWARFHPGLSINIRTTDYITGQDETLLVPNTPYPFGANITDPGNFGGEKAQLGGNVRVCLNDSCGLNINLKASMPIYQNLNGIQQRERFSVSSAISYSF